MNPDMIYSYTREVIERITGTKPEPDQDGDLHFRYLDAGFFARMHPEYPIVQVFTVALHEPVETIELFSALNDTNTQLVFARALYVGKQILIEQDVHASDLSPRYLDATCRQVADATDAVSDFLHSRVSGQLAFDFGKGEQYSHQKTQNLSVAVGPYL